MSNYYLLLKDLLDTSPKDGEDVYLTENCGLLQKLSPLADRGFTKYSAGMYGTEVHIPPFTKGKKQLSRIEIETARQLSHVRIHVERVIAIKQKFTILHSILPINIITSSNDNDVSFVDKIVTVCCALCNCCDSVVPCIHLYNVVIMYCFFPFPFLDLWLSGQYQALDLATGEMKPFYGTLIIVTTYHGIV